MRCLGFWCLFTILASISRPLDARDYGQMYTPSELQRANAVYSPNIKGLLFEDIAAHLLDRERISLRRVTLWQPWERSLTPLEFAANPITGVMLVPTFSVKFFDDLAVATAWFERWGCKTETIVDYMAALNFSTLDLPAPLAALAVPDKAYELDDFVDDVSQKTLKSALAFIMLHELGHIHHRHEAYEELTAREARAQEIEAAGFAMRVLRRMRVPPLGMALWFMVAGVGDPLPGSRRATHPLSADRLHAMARILRDNPSDFCQRRSKISPPGRSKTSPLNVMRSAVLGVVPVVHRRDPRCFV